MGMLADRLGHQNALILGTGVYALATWCLWLPSALNGSVSLYVGMSICHGLINSVFNIVMPSLQKRLFGDERYYPKNGAMTTIRGVGFVTGVPGPMISECCAPLTRQTGTCIPIMTPINVVVMLSQAQT